MGSCYRLWPLSGMVAALLVFGAGASPAAAELTPSRRCQDIQTGDGQRMLSVCARGFLSNDRKVVAAVVEMHTFKWNGGLAE